MVTLGVFSLQDKKAARFSKVQSIIPINAAFSPDGRWVAYSSGGLTARTNIYVEPFPPSDTKYQISKAGPTQRAPLWSRDGKELFYISGPNQFVVVDITTQLSFAFSNPMPVPKGFLEYSNGSARTYDVTPDGKVLGVIGAGQLQTATPSVPQIQVVLNWVEELKQRVPAK